MTRYLFRLANQGGYAPRQTGQLAERVRAILGSRESIGHLRISNNAIEFDLFANDQQDLAAKRTLLEEKVAKVLTVKTLDLPPAPREKFDVLKEGISLFNEERFWECHEVLEQIWHPSRGTERELIQGLILTAAALVHHQKAEKEVCLSMLRKASTKLASQLYFENIDLDYVRDKVRQMMESKSPQPFEIRLKAS